MGDADNRNQEERRRDDCVARLEAWFDSLPSEWQDLFADIDDHDPNMHHD